MMSSFSAKISGVVITALLLITLAESGPTNLDCRRFVFAPACRGATIKRSSLGNPVDAYVKSHVQSKSAEVADENNDESGPHWLENPQAEDEDDQPGLDNQSLWSVNIDRLEGAQPSKKITSGQHRHRNVGSRRWED